MTKFGASLVKSAKEALTIAKGELEPLSQCINEAGTCIGVDAKGSDAQVLLTKKKARGQSEL
jgi:hypothetical protein